MKKKKLGWDIKKRWWYLSVFVDESMREISNAEIVVWIMLWRDTKKNGLARTSISYLAERSGMSERMVKIGIKSLIEKGMVERVKRGRKMNGKAWLSLWRVYPFIGETGFPIPYKGTCSQMTKSEEDAIRKVWAEKLARRAAPTSNGSCD